MFKSLTRTTTNVTIVSKETEMKSLKPRHKIFAIRDEIEKYKGKIHKKYADAKVAMNQNARLSQAKEIEASLKEDPFLVDIKYEGRMHEKRRLFEIRLLKRTAEQFTLVYQLLLIKLDVDAVIQVHRYQYNHEEQMDSMGWCHGRYTGYCPIKLCEFQQLLSDTYPLDVEAKETLIHHANSLIELEQYYNEIRKLYLEYYYLNQTLEEELSNVAREHNTTRYKELLLLGANPVSQNGSYEYLHADEDYSFCCCSTCIEILQSVLRAGPQVLMNTDNFPEEAKKIVTTWDFSHEWSDRKSTAANLASLFNNYNGFFKAAENKQQSEYLNCFFQQPNLTEVEMLEKLLDQKQNFTAANQQGEYHRRMNFAIQKVATRENLENLINKITKININLPNTINTIPNTKLILDYCR